MEKADVLTAFSLQRKYPEYLTIRWYNVIGVILKEDSYTVNEISRILGLKRKQIAILKSSLCFMKHKGKVRKRFRRYELTDNRIVYYKQRDLRGF